MRVFYFINLEATMSAGTITLTNNSAAVSGAGTAFTTDLKAGDFIVSVVGGVTYTLPVKTVNSATGVTLLKNYDGPTQAGAAWSAVPRDTMNAITAQLAAETAQALRGLNYDKQNWQQVFSGGVSITTKLPDGSEFTGPSWKYLSDNMVTNDDLRLNTVNNKTGGNIKSDISVAGAVISRGNTVDTGGYAAATTTIGYAGSDAWHDLITVNGTIRWRFGITGIGTNPILIWQARELGGNPYSTPLTISPTDIIYTSRNTTKTADGTLKVASPIIKIFHDGTYETNEESQGAEAKRIREGVYQIKNVLGMNSDGAWGGIDGGFDVPKDRNGQRLLWLDYEVEADGSILVKTYHRTYPDAPAFARNIKEGYEEGDLIDIPSDQFVSVRVEMPQDSIWNLAQRAAQEEMEQEKTTEE